MYFYSAAETEASGKIFNKLSLSFSYLI